VEVSLSLDHLSFDQESFKLRLFYKIKNYYENDEHFVKQIMIPEAIYADNFYNGLSVFLHLFACLALSKNQSHY